MTVMRLPMLVTAVILFGAHTAAAAPQSPDTPNPLQQAAAEKTQAGPQSNVPSPDLIMVGQYSSELLAKAAQLGFIGSVVTGAPYTARGVTDSTTVLADGTHISHSVSYTIYRDSQGRLRREDPQGVWISDPVAQVTYLLDPATHSARQLPLAKLVAGAKRDAARSVGTGGATTTPQTAAEARAAAKMNAAGGAATPASRSGAAGSAAAGSQAAAAVPTTVTSLGRQVVEGLAADGSRSTSVIAVGTIGNDRPIEVISERWLSPDLQVLVMSRLQDPRNGDTTFHLTDIHRNEPDRSLFVVPAGYRIELGK
jgi:hypothetical protein